MISAIEARNKSGVVYEELEQGKLKAFKGITAYIEKRIKEETNKGEYSATITFEAFDKKLKYEKLPLETLKELYNLGYRVKEDGFMGNYVIVSWKD